MSGLFVVLYALSGAHAAALPIAMLAIHHNPGDAPRDGKAALTARAPCGGRHATGAGGAPPSCGGGVARRSRRGAGHATRCGRTHHEADAPARALGTTGDAHNVENLQLHMSLFGGLKRPVSDQKSPPHAPTACST